MDSKQFNEPAREKWWSVGVASSDAFKLRQSNRTLIVLALMACGLLAGIVAARMSGGPLWRHDMRHYEKTFQAWFLIVAIPAWIYVVVGCAKDLAYLDELGRRVHLETMSRTYLTGLALAVSLGYVCLLTGWRFNPLWFVVLELVRTGWLRVVARRYQ